MTAVLPTDLRSRLAAEVPGLLRYARTITAAAHRPRPSGDLHGLLGILDAVLTLKLLTSVSRDR